MTTPVPHAGNILAVIPARGGSKGVPRKNIRPLGGKPLIAHTIETALAAKQHFFRIIVSTDDDEIARVAQAYGADVPFMRPAELANDKAAMIPVVRHAIEATERASGVSIDWIMLLQPTCPFRSVEDIEACMALAAQGDTDSVISVVQVFAVHPMVMKRIEGNRLLPFCLEEKEGTRRQDYQPPAYMRNGAIYMTRRSTLMEHSSVWGRGIRPYVMPEQRSVNIDSEMDFRLAALMLEEGTKATRR